jgi:hypothetical protein
MNRRTLFKGLASFPLLRHLDLNLSTEVEAAPIEAELGIIRPAMCAPMEPMYDLFQTRVNWRYEWESRAATGCNASQKAKYT